MDESTIRKILGAGILSWERRPGGVWRYDAMFNYYPERCLAVDRFEVDMVIEVTGDLREAVRLADAAAVSPPPLSVIFLRP